MINIFKTIDDKMRISPKNWNIYIYWERGRERKLNGNSRTEKYIVTEEIENAIHEFTTE